MTQQPQEIALRNIQQQFSKGDRKRGVCDEITKQEFTEACKSQGITDLNVINNLFKTAANGSVKDGKLERRELDTFVVTGYKDANGNFSAGAGYASAETKRAEQAKLKIEIADINQQNSQKIIAGTEQKLEDSYAHTPDGYMKIYEAKIKLTAEEKIKIGTTSDQAWTEAKDEILGKKTSHRIAYEKSQELQKVKADQGWAGDTWEEFNNDFIGGTNSKLVAKQVKILTDVAFDPYKTDVEKAQTVNPTAVASVEKQIQDYKAYQENGAIGVKVVTGVTLAVGTALTGGLLGVGAAGASGATAAAAELGTSSAIAASGATTTTIAGSVSNWVAANYGLILADAATGALVEGSDAYTSEGRRDETLSTGLTGSVEGAVGGAILRPVSKIAGKYISKAYNAFSGADEAANAAAKALPEGAPTQDLVEGQDSWVISSEANPQPSPQIKNQTYTPPVQDVPVEPIFVDGAPNNKLKSQVDSSPALNSGLPKEEVVEDVVENGIDTIENTANPKTSSNPGQAPGESAPIPEAVPEASGNTQSAEGGKRNINNRKANLKQEIANELREQGRTQDAAKLETEIADGNYNIPKQFEMNAMWNGAPSYDNLIQEAAKKNNYEIIPTNNGISVAFSGTDDELLIMQRVLYNQGIVTVLEPPSSDWGRVLRVKSAHGAKVAEDLNVAIRAGDNGSNPWDFRADGHFFDENSHNSKNNQWNAYEQRAGDPRFQNVVNEALTYVDVEDLTKLQSESGGRIYKILKGVKNGKTFYQIDVDPSYSRSEVLNALNINPNANIRVTASRDINGHDILVIPEDTTPAGMKAAEEFAADLEKKWQQAEPGFIKKQTYRKQKQDSDWNYSGNESRIDYMARELENTLKEAINNPLGAPTDFARDYILKSKYLFEHNPEYKKLMEFSKNPNIPQDELRSLYRKLVLQVHPDKFIDENEKLVMAEIFKDISIMYDFRMALLNDVKP